jgi:hypothetical protein
VSPNRAYVNSNLSDQSLWLRCLDDVDDEVRDRAAFNLKLMSDEPLADAFVRDGSSSHILQPLFFANW